MHKIKRASFYFRILFQVLFVVIPLSLVLFWAFAPLELGFQKQGFSFSFIPQGMAEKILVHPISGTTKFLGFLVSLIPVLITEYVLYFLIRLFRLYERGEIFALQNVTYIKNIGYLVLLSQVVNPIYQALISATLTWNNPVGERFVLISFQSANIGMIIVALLVILISWIMSEGCKMREEQKYTV